MEQKQKPETRQFELVIRSRKQGVEDIRRTVTLWADLGVLEDLKNDPAEPLDLLTDTAAIERVATDKFLQGRLLYALSDCHDLDPVVFARGVVAGQLPEALAALKGALRDFFQSIELPDVAQAMDEAFKAMVAMRRKLADTAAGANISAKICDALDGADVEQMMDAAAAEVRENLRERVGKISKPGTPG